MIRVEIDYSQLRRVPYTGKPYVGWQAMLVAAVLAEAGIPVIRNSLTGVFVGLKSGHLARENNIENGNAVFTWESAEEKP